MDDLIEKAISGDKAAEQELFRELLVRFRHFAAHKVGDEDADEIAQKACIRIFEKYRSEEFTTGFRAWAYGVFKMTIREYHRDRARMSRKEMRFPERFELPQTETAHPMLKTHLLECVKSLSRSYPKYARIVNLRYQGYDTGEICQRLGINREQYYVYVGRGRTALRDCLVEKGAL